jgi:hypothetical protein
VDHQQASIVQLDRHHLQRDSRRILAKEHKPCAGASRRIDGRILLEAQFAVLDDVAGTFT